MFTSEVKSFVRSDNGKFDRLALKGYRCIALHLSLQAIVAELGRVPSSSRELKRNGRFDNDALFVRTRGQLLTDINTINRRIYNIVE